MWTIRDDPDKPEIVREHEGTFIVAGGTDRRASHQPGDRHPRHDDRRPRPRPGAARRVSLLDRRSVRRSSTTSRSAASPACRSMRSSHSLEPAPRAGALAARSRAALYAVGDNAQAARLCGFPVLRLRALAYVGMRRLRRRLRRAYGGAHRRHQPVDRGRDGVLRDRRRGARRRRPSVRPRQGRADASSAR